MLPRFKSISVWVLLLLVLLGLFVVFERAVQFEKGVPPLYPRHIAVTNPSFVLNSRPKNVLVSEDSTPPVKVTFCNEGRALQSHWLFRLRCASKPGSRRTTAKKQHS